MIFVGNDNFPYCVNAAIEKQVAEYNESVARHLKGISFDYQISVTGLNKSPRQMALIKRHYDDIVVKAEDRSHLLDGSVFHSILENNPEPGALIENRFGLKFKIQGRIVYIHGAADYYHPEKKLLLDYKRTSIFSLSTPKDDYEFQLNALALLIKGQKSHTYEVEEIGNVFSIKDWRSSRRGINGYPDLPIITRKYKMWDSSAIAVEIAKRARDHMLASDTPDEKLPYCSDEFRWKRDKFRIRKFTKGGVLSKSSSGTYPTEDEARLAAEEKGIELYQLERFPGSPLKCIKFCDVSNFCSQRQMEIVSSKETKEEQDIDVEDII